MHGASQPRVCAVSYLNTVPLVWGLLRGPQRGAVDLRFALPSECAEELRAGRADVGLVPVAELARQPDLAVVPGSAIACRGAVRSILLVSKAPFAEIRTLAADAGSRTSVVLAQVLLARRHGARPAVETMAPRLDAMLAAADAALVIGDPALRIDPRLAEWRGAAVRALDLGAEWFAWTGLPMVFAVWAAKPRVADEPLAPLFEASKAWGLARIDEIVAAESARLDLDAALVRRYLTEFVRFDLGEQERLGLARYLHEAADLGLVPGFEPRFLEPAVAAAG